MALPPLPVDEHVARIVAEVRRARAAVVTAPPGAGKTTRIPPALVEDGAVVVLQPRRVAARAIARRIAHERGWTIGDRVGWQVRFERRFSEHTRLLIVTEGILTARLQSDPLLSAFTTIVLDEFHERSVHADVALALARQAWLARRDLRIVIMSATLEAAPVARFLGDCPTIDIPGRAFPIDVRYAPAEPLPAAVTAALAATSGDVLAFLPGAPEIERAAAELRSTATGAAEVLPLHGSLDAEAQDRVFAPAAGRRVILATNIAETSITVPKVSAVVDTGLQKVARYDGARAIDSLVLERVTQDAADQRAGRAGRTGPGLALRLWDERDRLRSHREPELARVDLAAPLLDVLAWGGDPLTLEWFERPPEHAITAALALLSSLDAVEGGRISTLGRRLQQLPLHPRLSRMLLAAGAAWEAAIACAALSERTFVPQRQTATTCDLLSAVDHADRLPPHVLRVARHIQGLAAQTLGREARSHVTEEELRRAILAGYPDRVAQRRAPGSPRLLLASGTGALLSGESGVTAGEFLVALDVQAGLPERARGKPVEARVRMASRVERDWLAPDASAIEWRFDEPSGVVRGVEIIRYGSLLLSERPVPADPARAASVLAREYARRGPTDADRRLLRRLAFAGHPVTFDELLERASAGARRLDDISLARALDPHLRRALEKLAPERLVLPSGRSVALDYREDTTVAASVKLQELFGVAETPRLGPNREPVLLLLLAPNGRPVQTTRDLKSFWERTYPEVRKELRGRYPKHAWPEKPEGR
ncbi:MAG TPA: ATP-dependent helicase C-terminal domain-containing protein [Vicinamibacterales bacterium]|nr:ATP-dependent helicase C-terminal domain-containing protein [Vicinamibacterales bacterium]